MPQIRKRVVLHFPGYEPLDAEAHYSRYARSAMQSGRAWNFRVEAGPLGGDPAAPCFSVRAEGLAGAPTVASTSWTTTG